MPDREDLNNDNTVNEVESYFQYQIDLKPGQLQVGQGFVVDKVNEGEWIGIYFEFLSRINVITQHLRERCRASNPYVFLECY